MHSIILPPSSIRLQDKWTSQTSLLGACLCALCGGVVYSFSLYGPQLADSLGYTSVQINTIAMAGNMGVLVSSPLFGYLSDTQLPSRIVKLSSLLFLVGFSGMSLTYQGILPYQHFLVMTSYYFLVGVAGGASYITATSITGHNFKNSRGFGIGLPVTFFGLSAFLFSIINQLLFVVGDIHDTPGLFKFLGLTTSIVTFFGSFLLVKIDYNRLLEESRSLQGPLSSGYRSIEPEYSISPSEFAHPTTCLTMENNIEGRQFFLNRDAQMLFISIMLIGGSGIVYINNIGTVLHTINFVNPISNLAQLQSLSVSILSLSNCGGRLLFTAISDYLANLRKPFQRVSWLIASGLLLGSMLLVAAYTTSEYILLCTSIIGIGYGIMFAVAPTMTSVWFGTAHFGANYGWMNVAPAIGGQLLSILFGAIYDSHITHKTSEDSNICQLGTSCYQFTFQFMSALCFFASFLALILKWRRESHF